MRDEDTLSPQLVAWIERFVALDGTDPSNRLQGHH